MTWNYRIVRYHDDKGFGLHEVYYDEAGQPKSMTASPVGFACGVEEGPDGIRGSLMTAHSDAMQRPVFDEPKEWAERTEIATR